MFAIDGVLVSDLIVDAPFACNLSKCLGGCCVQGDSGAPLEPEERSKLEEALPVVRKYLAPEALNVIEEEGVWEEKEQGQFATTCVGEDACVFVTYEGRVAKCSLHKAYWKGELNWEKPLSCHLYPIRVSNYGGRQVLNYEQVPMCAPACIKGRRNDVQLYDFLKRPLIRKYGEAWYKKFRAACVNGTRARDK